MSYNIHFLVRCGIRQLFNTCICELLLVLYMGEFLRKWPLLCFAFLIETALLSLLYSLISLWYMYTLCWKCEVKYHMDIQNQFIHVVEEFSYLINSVLLNYGDFFLARFSRQTAS